MENGKPKAILRNFLRRDGRGTETLDGKLASLIEGIKQLLFLHKAII
jgi:hypothetical protein